MADFKVKHFKRVMLLNKVPIGYIMILEDGATPAHVYSLWGGQNSDGYQLTDWGHKKTTFDTKDYEDGFSSTVLLSGITNNRTITEMSASDMTANGTLDLNSVLVGVTPRSIDAGIIQTSDGTGSMSISEETYKAYVRKVGWILSHSASAVILCCDPLLAVNFGSYALIANYMEVTITFATPTYSFTTKRVNSRVRWGDSGSALCQILVAEDINANTAGYQDLIETPGQITGLVPFDDRIATLKNESIYEGVYTGVPRVFDFSITVPDNGTLSTKSVKKTGRKSFFFIGNDSFYIYNQGGQLEDLGKNIRERFFGYNAEFSIEDIQKAIVQVYDDRQEIWLWMPTKLGNPCSEVYKLKGGSWTMNDYSNYGHGHIGCIGKDYYVSGVSSKGWVPIVFFDELNLTTTDSTEYGVLVLNVAPATAWAVGDTITEAGVAHCHIVDIIDTTHYTVQGLTGTFSAAALLTNGTVAAQQTAAYPTYTANQIATLNCYRDLQSGVSNNTAHFTTKDYPLDLGGRVSELKFQAKCGTGYSTLCTVYYSVDEGNTWEGAQTIEILSASDLDWYSFTFDVTAESIRFKLETEGDVSIGKTKLVASDRRRENE